MNIFEELDFKMGLEELKGDLPVLKEYYATAAEALYSYYKALKSSGFTEAQALEIVIAHGFNPASSSAGAYDQTFVDDED